MAPNNTAANFADMTKAHEAFAAATATCRGYQAEFNNIQANCLANYKGDSGPVFQQKLTEWHEDYVKVVNALQNMTNELADSTKDYVQSEAEKTALVNSLAPKLY